MKAKLFSLVKKDWVNAFLMFVLSTVLGLVGDAIMQEVSSGNYSLTSIHWKEIGAAVVLAVVSYLKKNFLSNENGEFLKKSTDASK